MEAHERAGNSNQTVGDVAGPDDTSATLGAAAARRALATAGLAAGEIDLIVCATSTPDHLAMPSTACLIQHALGASRAAAFDVSAACTGFVYGLAVGTQFIAGITNKEITTVRIEENLMAMVEILKVEKDGNLRSFDKQTVDLLTAGNPDQLGWSDITKPASLDSTSIAGSK